MLHRPGSNLRRMGDEQHLGRSGETLEPFSDGRCDGAAYAAIDLVEHQHRRRARFSKRNLERECETRELAARGDFCKSAEGGTLDGRDLEGHAFETVGVRFGERCKGDPKTRVAELQGCEL